MIHLWTSSEITRVMYTAMPKYTKENVTNENIMFMFMFIYFTTEKNEETRMEFEFDMEYTAPQAYSFKHYRV